MTKETSLDTLHQLSSLCDNKSSLQARLALASFSNHSRDSILLEKGLMLFEYLQLISPLLMATIMLNFNKDSAIFQAFSFLARLVNPAYWISFDETGTLENILFILVCIFTVVKVLLFFEVLHRCLHSTEAPEGRLVTVWRFLMKFQSRIAYFYVSSFYIAAIRVVDWETYQTKDNQSIAFKVTAILLSVLELLLALVPKIYYHHMLPTKSFLSAKENTLEVITLLQKVFVQIMTGGLDLSLAENSWIFASVNVCIDIFRISNFFIRLPFYNFRGLYFQGHLLMMIASLNLAYFICFMIKEVDSESRNIWFSLFLWGVFLCFGILASNNFLKEAYWRIACDPSLGSPNLLVHRVVVIEESQGYAKRNLEENIRKNDFELLVWKTINLHVGRILWTNKKTEDLVDKKNLKILFKTYLEKLQEKFPHDKFLQLFLAEFYFKKMQIYNDPIKTCLNLQQSHNKNLKINAELLLISIQNQIKDKSKDHSHQLDVLNFLSEHTFTAKLRQEMLKQAALQIEICSEIMKDAPNLELIYQKSQNAHLYRGSIMKKINHLSTMLHDYNVEPLLLSAEYSLSVNHSVVDYLNFTKLSSQKLSKYQKIFAQEKLCPENVFQDNVGFLKISGAKGEAGKIIYATKQIGEILGGDSRHYSGTLFPQRAPPIFRRIYIEGWKQVSENSGTNSFIGQVNREFFFHFDGYLVEVEYFIDIHPFTTQGFAFMFIFRPVVSNREYLLLYENGDIDSASKGLIEKLGLELQVMRINIGDLNGELGEVNEAFNVTAFPQKYGMEEFEEAKDIYSKYTTDGVDISLKCQRNLETSYSYNCKIKNVAFGPVLVKVLTFEENKRENRTNEQLSQQNASENFIIDEEMTKRPDLPLIVSPKTEGEFLSTERPLIPPKSRTKKRNNTKLSTNTLNRLDHDKRLEGLPGMHSFSSDMSEEDDEAVIYRKVNTGKNISQISQEKRISNIFQVSLDSKYYSKTFKALTLGFYLTLGVLIILKFVATVTSASYMDSLVAKKDIFSNNGYRNYMLIEASGLARYVWQFTSGALSLAGYPASFSAGLNTTKGLVMSNIQSLRETNINLLRASSILSGEEHDAVYKKNVKVYNTYFDAPVQDFVMMDSLQATDRVIEAALAVYYSLFDPVFNPEIIPRAQFLFRNSVNDLILANNQLSATMVDSFDNQFSQLKALSLHFTVIFTVLIWALLGILIFFLWRQYSADMFLITAVSRLNHNKIQAIHKELVNFQKYLKQQNENSIEEIDKDRNLVKPLKKREETNLPISRREFVKSPDNKALRKKYLKQSLWIVAILLILIVLIIVNALMIDARLNKIKSAQEKIYFINHIRIRMSLTSTSIRELAATNNTAYIENNQALTELELLLEQLDTLRTEIYSTLLIEEVIGDNPEIETLLLGDGCSLLPSTFASYCRTLKKMGIASGFINLMNEFEGYMRGKIETYKRSDKSAEALADLQMKDYSVRGVIYITSLYEMTLLWATMDRFFLEKVQADEDGTKISLSLFVAIVVFLGVTGWKFVLKGLGESVNRLKNILRVFPAGLILGNFTFKMFLMKTSKEGLEQIRNEI